MMMESSNICRMPILAINHAQGRLYKVSQSLIESARVRFLFGVVGVKGKKLLFLREIRQKFEGSLIAFKKLFDEF
jgi:hypothetical protein